MAAWSFIRYHGLRHPAEMGAPEVEAFLTWLVAERNFSASTHRQAVSALLFLYSKVFAMQLPWRSEVGRPQREAAVARRVVAGIRNGHAGCPRDCGCE